MKNKEYFVGAFFFVVCLLLSCNRGIEANADGIGIDEITVKAWKGNGSGGKDHIKTLAKGVPVYNAKGESDDAQTVIACLKPSQVLQEGRFYELTTEVLAEGLEKNFDFIAAIRAGKTNDVFEVFDYAEEWRKITLLIKPTATAVPKYIAIRLYGEGKVWATPFTFREIDATEFDRLTKELKAEKELEAAKRIERVMVKAPASLPLATEHSPQLFKIWGKEEEQFPPIPQGWKQVPGERAELSADVADKLKEKEYLLYTRNEATPIYLESVPRADELTNTIHATATPGEYEPLNFALYAGKNIDGIRMEMSDLVSLEGQRISKANMDLRTVNFVRKIKDQGKKTYFLMPMTLSKGPDLVDAGTSRRYWLTVYVPKTAKAGTYKGVIELVPANARINKINVQLKVLPFDLIDPPVTRFMWAPKVAFPGNDEKMNLDLREHGMTTMMLGGEVRTRDRKVDQQDIDHIVDSINSGVEMHRRLGFRDRPIGGISNNQIINYWDKTINWFRFWPITRELDEEFITTYNKVFLEEGKKRKWPEIYHYIVDEPGGANPKNLEPTQHYLTLFKKRLPELETFVTIGGGMKQGHDEIGMLSPNLNVTATNFVTKDVIERLGKLRSAFWIYNGSSLNTEPIKERFFYGWYAWKIGAQGVGQWTYAWTGSPFADIFRDNRQDYALETKNGFIPTVGLEMIREGVDDYKYIYTLQKLIDLGLSSGQKDFRTQAQEAKAVLVEHRKKININYQRGSDVPESKITGISSDDLASFRVAVINSITKLISANKTPWSQLKEKLVHVKAVVHQSLTEQDWKTGGALHPLSGNDLLADTKIGGIMSDWKIQVWKGNGGGEIESKMTLGKAKTSRLYIESEEKGDNAVLVLHKPSIILKRSVKYRLSSWIKTENVAQHAVLFAAVRGGGISDVMSAKVQGNSDWRQIWADFTPDDDTPIQYMALRLWGKGTVYTSRILLQVIQ